MGNCTRQSPYLQELSVFFGQDTCYGSAEDVLHKTLRISVSDSSIFRITNQIGLDSEVFMPESYLNECINQAVYTMIDGSMLLTREDKWKEVKVARIFQENHHGEISKNRSEIQQSLYLAHLGGHLEFEERLQKLLDPLEKQAQTMIFINDGAIWIKDFISTFYPKAIQIIDFYHVKEHIGDFAKIAFINKEKRSEWIENMAELLLDSDLDTIIDEINTCEIPNKDENIKKALLNYLENNRFRMNYKFYRSKNWLIGSGPIESAQRTVVQQRLKLSGQRWNIQNAQNVLNLRTCHMSNQWQTVVNKCRCAA
jgi:hypothetical protein